MRCGLGTLGKHVMTLVSARLPFGGASGRTSAVGRDMDICEM